ncbi:enhancer of mRNA-decapping protein 4 [Aplysia californica]|uniref:Enhancer of mRNA-decapping protein 4 n=1 Tax=Aplysia californica TaxID=6500 RepID=A0ABM0JL79_APLCA|nr:enhancer of mRNA-decapping protein 4 [Aplysia californica]
MDSDDGGSIATASTDTSLFLRELQALNTEGGTGPICASQSLGSSIIEVTASGDDADSDTLPQALEKMIGERRPPAQVINLAENADENGINVYSPEVEVHAAPTSTSGSYVEKSAGSNKVKVTTVVKHVWELKYYHGNLVAVHRDADFVAYVLRGQSGGNVRVISRKTAHRVLLKTFSGNVLDIAFALSDDVYLAAVDETGSLYVHSFVMEGDYIISKLLLHVERESFDLESSFRSWARVIWCPFMPDQDYEDDGVDASKMLVLLHGSRAEVWNVDLVAKEAGPEPVTSKSVENGGVMVIEPNPKREDGAVVNAAFAPDGSAIGIAYHSGIVSFHLVNIDTGENECMHEWTPHPNEPVTSLFFLDDHRRRVNDQQLWKFALTGAKFNTEIKIWSCESWKCVQTLTFNPPLSQPELTLQLKSSIDLTSRYCTLSDINSGVLYIMQLHMDYTVTAAHVTSLSQFSLAQPCVSCAIFDAGVKKFRHSADDSHLDEITTGELDHNHEDNYDGSTNGVDSEGQVTTGIQIKMYGVHTKCLQELLIRYRPEYAIPPAVTPSIVSLSQEESGLRDMLSDMSVDQSEASQEDSQQALDMSQPLLMTPEAFSSSSPSGPKGKNSMAQSDAGHLSASSTSSFTQVTAMNEDLMGLDSPRSSVEPMSIISPSISYSQTPSKPSPGGHNSSLSDFPLPPITSAEEDELASTPHNLSRSGSLNTSAVNKSNQEILEEMFSGIQEVPVVSGLGHSIESSSSTGSFPVTSLKSAFSREERYDENDKEVAEALGVTPIGEGDVDDIEDRELEIPAATPPTDAADERNEVVWPEPPNVSTEAKRLVDEAIEQSTQEEEGKDTDYDDNDEAEVEEIIQHEANDDDENDGDDEADDNAMPGFTERPHRPEKEQASMRVLTSLDANIASLTQQLQQQQEIMQQMQQELSHQREIQLQLHRQQREQQQLQQMAVQQPSLEKDISKLEDILISRMEHSLAQHMQRETQRLQDSLKKNDAQRKTRDEALQMAVVNDVSRAVKDTVGNTLRTEIKQTVNPALHRFVEPLKEKIHQEVAQRLTACDSLLKDNISKAVKSRSTMDVLASSVGDVIYQQMQQAYTDTFQSAMLPSFKATMEKTVRDVHGVFQQGTKEYQLYMRQNVEQMVRERAASDDIVQRIEEAEHQFLESVQHMKSLVLSSVKEELAGQVTQAVSSVKSEIVSDVRKVMKEEVTTALQEHGASISDKLTTYLRSGAATPVSFTSEEELSKERIMRELKSGRINEAFQSALSASNLELVMFVCESAHPLNIFSQDPLPLTQPVLLSLISQLSASLDKNFDLKMKFLEEAVLNLDLNQPMTAEHIPGVLGALVQRLGSTKAHNGDSKKIKAIRMLAMAANSLLT